MNGMEVQDFSLLFSNGSSEDCVLLFSLLCHMTLDEFIGRESTYFLTYLFSFLFQLGLKHIMDADGKTTFVKSHVRTSFRILIFDQ